MLNEYLVSIADKRGEKLYKYWIENHAEPYIKKWLEEHEYKVDSCKTTEYVEYITNHFIDWITGSD